MTTQAQLVGELNALVKGGVKALKAVKAIPSSARFGFQRGPVSGHAGFAVLFTAKAGYVHHDTLGMFRLVA